MKTMIKNFSALFLMIVVAACISGVDPKQGTVDLYIGETQVFNCEADGDLTWYLDGNKVGEGDTYKFLAEEIGTFTLKVVETFRGTDDSRQWTINVKKEDFELGTKFSLNYQETKYNNNEKIAIKFERVVTDSRCPIDVVCVWAGNAEVEFTFSKSSVSETFILNTNINPFKISLFGYDIELIGLSPAQFTSDNPLAQEDYVASLVIKKSDPGYCWNNEMCGEHNYCSFADCAIESGVCQPRPEACIEIYAPVCGCDGNTYSNFCYAAMAGVSVDYEGECEQAGGCISNSDCKDSSEYCEIEPGDCNGKGVCAPNPELCPMIWNPVCGCDEKTYGNACNAAATGVNVDYKGECRRDTSCDDGTMPLCKMMPPVCHGHEILAYKNNCYVCVNPATCLPWGEPQCSNDKDCPEENMVCDPCGSSSCYFCDDCVPACVLP